MIISIEKNHNSFIYRLLSAFIAFTFIFSVVIPPSSAQMLPQAFSLPAVGTMITQTPAFMPAVIKGITIYPDNPLMFDFIIDTGDSKLSGDALEDESTKLIKYFLASLTVPEDDQWVNLSPYEGNRIIADSFGVTEMGRDLLAQDYLLKQLTASLMSPEEDLGSEFWERVYEKAQARFGTTNIPMNTFNKIWIVPEDATVYEHEGSAFVVKSHLRVMLEEDYFALNANIDDEKFGMLDLIGDEAKVASGVTSAIVKEILIPEIEHEVNTGETFANLRQIYNSMILATWYKIALEDSLLGQVYVDKGKVKGVDIEDVNAKEKIYNQYVEAFKEGVYNYIKEEYDPATQQIIPRKYFSGGAMKVDRAQLAKNIIKQSDLAMRGADAKVAIVRKGLQSTNVFNVTGFALEQTEKTDPAMITANARQVRDSAMLSTFQNKIAILSKQSRTNEATVNKNLIQNIRKNVLLEDLAESVGALKPTVLEVMKQHGFAAQEESMGELEYDVNGTIFDTTKWSSFLSDLRESSPEPALARFDDVALERVITTSFDIEGIFESFAGNFKGNQLSFVNSLVGSFTDIAASKKLKMVLESPDKELSDIDLNKIVSSDAGKDYKANGISPTFSLTPGAKADVDKVNEVASYQKTVVDEVLSKGSFFHRGVGTDQTIQDYYENEFKPGPQEDIVSFINRRFGENGKNLKAFATGGIGANDQFNWALVDMYNRNRPEGAPKWYHIYSAEQLLQMQKEMGEDFVPEKILFEDVSRSGSTWEGVEAAMRTVGVDFADGKRFLNKIILANDGGALEMMATKINREGEGEALQIHMAPHIGGRNMYGKTVIYYTAMTIAGMFNSDMGPEVFAELNHEYDVANDYKNPDSLAVNAAKFVHANMTLEGRENVVFMHNSDSLIHTGSIFEQFFMEGANKEHRISLSEHDLRTDKEPEYVLDNMAHEKSIGFAIVDKGSDSYEQEIARIEVLKGKMPMMVLEIDSGAESEFENIKGINPRMQAGLNILAVDFVVALTTMLRVNSNSNPNVKAVRALTANYVSNWAQRAEMYANDPIGTGEAPVLVSLGRPGTAEQSAIGVESKQIALKDIESAERVARELVQELLNEGALAERDRINLLGKDGMEGFLRNERNKIYGTNLVTKNKFIPSDHYHPHAAHRSHEAILAHSENKDNPLIANKSVNIAMNQRKPASAFDENGNYDTRYDKQLTDETGTGKYANLLDENGKGPSVSQSFDAMSVPNFERAAQVAPTAFLEFDHMTSEIEGILGAFNAAFVNELSTVVSNLQIDLAMLASEAIEDLDAMDDFFRKGSADFTVESADEMSKQIFELGNMNERKADFDSADDYDAFLVKKSILARDLAGQLMKSENKQIRESVIASAYEKIGEILGDTDKGKIQFRNAKLFFGEWLNPDNGIPEYLVQGLLRAMLEQRTADLIDAYAEGWREFGTAGIRGTAVASKFAAIMKQELKEFAENPHAPVLGGPNYINSVVLLQQVAAVTRIMRNLRDKLENDPTHASVRNLTEELKERLRNNRVAIAYDSRLNGEYSASILAAAFLRNGVDVDFFDSPSGVPGLVWGANAEGLNELTGGSAFGILISASHSENNYNGFKAFLASLLAQVDQENKALIMNAREELSYADMSLDLIKGSVDDVYKGIGEIFQNSDGENGNAKLRWIGGPERQADKEYFNREHIDFYTWYYGKIRNRAPSAKYLSKEDQEAVMAERRKLNKRYSAFYGGGAKKVKSRGKNGEEIEINGVDFDTFFKESGFEKNKTVKKQTDLMNGMFPDMKQPDPGDVLGWVAAFVATFVQEAGENFSNLEAAIEMINNEELWDGTDPDLDRAASVLGLPKGVKGNLKDRVLVALAAYLESADIFKNKDEVKANILNTVEDKLNDKYLLTANDAWQFIAHYKLEMMNQGGHLKKDQVYFIEKSHVTTSGLERVALKWRQKGFQVYVVDTWVGFTEIGAAANQIFKIAEQAANVLKGGERVAESIQSMENILSHVEEVNPTESETDDGKTFYSLVNDTISLARRQLSGELSGVEENLLEQNLTALSRSENIAGVEESNGYGEMGYYDPVAGKVVDNHIYDKDGGLAAFIFADLVAWGKTKGISPYDMYTDMGKELGKVVDENLALRYPGFEGKDQKFGAIEILEKIFAVSVLKQLDLGQTPQMFYGKYSVKDIAVYRAGKYDNNFRGLPEEGVRLILDVHDEDGTTLGEAIVTYRPSGTGDSNRDYNWFLAVKPEEGQNFEDYRASAEKIKSAMRKYFWGTEADVESDFNGEEVVMYSDANPEQFFGLLLSLKQTHVEGYKKNTLVGEAFDSMRLSLGKAMGQNDPLQLTDAEEALRDVVQNYTFADRKQQWFSKDSDSREKGINSMMQARIANSKAWDDYLSSEEASQYLQGIKTADNIVKITIGTETISVPRAIARGFKAGLVDYVASLMQERNIGMEDISSTDGEVEILVRQRFEEGWAQQVELSQNQVDSINVSNAIDRIQIKAAGKTNKAEPIYFEIDKGKVSAVSDGRESVVIEDGAVAVDFSNADGDLGIKVSREGDILRVENATETSLASFYSTATPRSFLDQLAENKKKELKDKATLTETKEVNAEVNEILVSYGDRLLGAVNDVVESDGTISNRSELKQEIMKIASDVRSSPVIQNDRRAGKDSLDVDSDVEIMRDVLVAVVDRYVETNPERMIQEEVDIFKGAISSMIGDLNQRYESFKDKAMIKEKDLPLGGIDLNPELLDLQIKRDGNGVPLPVNLQDFDNMNIQGFMPVIINVTPIPSLPMMLGFSEEGVEGVDEYASANSLVEAYSLAASRRFVLEV